MQLPLYTKCLGVTRFGYGFENFEKRSNIKEPLMKPEHTNLKNNLFEKSTHRLKTEALENDFSQRITHDLKSPLGTLGMMLKTDLKNAPMQTKESIRKVLTRIRTIVDGNLKEYSSDIFERANSASPSNLIVSKQPLSAIGGAIRTIIEEEQENATRRGVVITCDL